MRGSPSSVSRQSTSSPMRSFCRCGDAALPIRTCPLPPKPARCGSICSVEVAFAADAVDRLQRPVLGDVAQEADELLALAQVAQAAQRLDDEGRVAQPAVAVVPGALGAHRFGDAGGGGGDDRAGVVVGMELQAQRGAQHVPRGEGRQRAGLRPGAPPGDREIQARCSARRVRLRTVRPSPKASRGTRLVEHEVVAAEQAGGSGCWSARGSGPAHRAPRGRRRFRRSRRAARRSRAAGRNRCGVRGRPSQRSQDADDLDRRANVEAVGNARREVDDLPRVHRRARSECATRWCCVRRSGRRESRRPAREDAARPAALAIEQATEQRRRVEAWHGRATRSRWSGRPARERARCRSRRDRAPER